MAPPVARKKDLESENADLRRTLAEMQKNLSAFKGELTQAKAESPKSSAVLSIEEKFLSFERRIMEEINRLLSRSDAFEERLDALEQYSRRNCLLIRGIPEKPKEDCLLHAIALFRDKLNVSIDINWLDRAHRVGLPRSLSDDKPRPIIVKFISYQDRHKVWINKKALKGTGFLITESLTTARTTVLQAARDLVGPRNAWTQDGKIVFLRPDGSRVYASTIKEVNAVGETITPSNAVRSRRRN